MKKFFASLLLFLFLSTLSFSAYKERIIIQFDRMKKLPSHWWVFDNIKCHFEESTNPIAGKKFLRISGQAEDWYVGGCGAYIVEDCTGFNSIEFMIRGYGDDCGRIKIQLFDDDNNNAQIEQDKNFNPINDDRWEYELRVEWNGWEKYTINFDEFTDTNPGIGNDKFDPYKTWNSGGLVQMQLIFIAPTEKGKIYPGIGAVRLVNVE